MQLADTVYLLAGLAGEDRHAETFLLVSRIVTPEIHQVIPGYTQLARISLHIFIEKPFVKIIMTSGYGSMYQLHGLPEIQAAIYVITKPLDIDQCGMPLITVIYIFRYT